jgi:FixJ family two-component response regulator
MKEAEKTIIFVIDDDPSVRKAISHLLRSEGYVVEAFESAESFLNRKRFLGSGCIVLDISMKHMDGLELQEELIRKHLELPIVFVTGHGDIPTSVKAMKKGAYDFLTKPFNDEEFLAAVSGAVKKNEGNIGNIKEKEVIYEEMMKLTGREKEILKFVIAGYMNKEISASLNIAEPTVKIHRSHLMRKLGVDSVAELVRKAEKADIVPQKR